ncbi:MAG TPA: hypothetical protein VLU46_05625 [Thermoanaerobaculia bacterium]|nr:hypothetical protein [Thermoanaerobaculia bacterium]
MPFPEHIERVFAAFGIAPDTKAALYELYVSMGAEVLEVFAEMSEKVEAPSQLRPEDTQRIREILVQRYLERNHPRWFDNLPTPSFWSPRVSEGRASGLAVPLGDVADVAKRVVVDDQPIPAGILMLGRNAHFGGREETISFDVVAAELADAIAIGKAAGQQHTLPGSVGETSGTFDGRRNVALIWEVQPNVFKPAGERNRAIAKVYRRHRNWHLITLAAALEWLRGRGTTTYILRGEALAITHEVNPQKPVSPMIAELHNRTVCEVNAALGIVRREATLEDDAILRESIVMNHALRKHVLGHGAGEVIWRAEYEVH